MARWHFSGAWPAYWWRRFCWAPANQRALTFTNGGFESVSGIPIPSDTGRTLNAGDTWLTGWSAGGTNRSVLVQSGYDGEYFFGYLDGMIPWQGEQWVIFPNDNLGGSLFQTFQTGVGDYCSMAFAGTYVYTADDPMLGMEIEASNGTVLTNNTYGVCYREWTNFQFSFIATTRPQRSHSSTPRPMLKAPTSASMA